MVRRGKQKEGKSGGQPTYPTCGESGSSSPAKAARVLRASAGLLEPAYRPLPPVPVNLRYREAIVQKKIKNVSTRVGVGAHRNKVAFQYFNIRFELGFGFGTPNLPLPDAVSYTFVIE